MAIAPPTPEERDANLDSLVEAVDKWFEIEQSRLDNESTFLRAVAKGRGAQDVGSKNLFKASSLLQKEVDEFLGV